MTAASVGFQCPECIHDSARAAPVYTAASMPLERPWVTYVLIAMNLVVFVAELVGTTQAGGSSSDLLNGARGTIYEHGVLWGPLVGRGEWWRLITGGFLHAGLLHVGMNMFVLYRIGPQLEKMLGWARYLSLYVAALLAGSLGVMIVSPMTPTLGASGAIFGLLGAAAAYQVSHKINIMQSGLGALIMINVFITFVGSSFISVGGHLGGLVGGAAVGYLLFQLEEREQSQWLGVAMACGVGLACLVTAILIAPTAIPASLR